MQERGGAMEVNAEQAVLHYTEAYQKLYRRTPKDMRVLDHEWVMVNGARMRVAELEYVTRQLNEEYHQGLEERRSVISRLIRWLKQ